jgi:serine/threonine-protein kinase
VLTNAHLHYRVNFVASNGPQNVVLSQSPAAGASVPRASTVTISIPQPTNQVTVPNLAGLTPQQATSQLSGESLSVGSQSQACSNSYPAGQVSGSSPSAGTSVGRGTSVNLVVSTGPCQVVVRNVVSQSAASAAGSLQGQGLQVAQNTTGSCPATENGNVVSQNPPAGTQVNLPATVTITVCSAAPTTNPPPPTTTSSTTTSTTG